MPDAQRASTQPPAILVLSPEAHDQLGGLASYLRGIVTALGPEHAVTFLGRARATLSTHRPVRSTPTTADASPHLTQLATRSRAEQIWQALRWALRCRLRRQPTLTLCGHLHLAPLAVLVQRLAGGRSLLVLLGLESWQAPSSPAARRAASRFDRYVSVSRFTAERFGRWSGVDAGRIIVIPPAVDPEPFRRVTRDNVLSLRRELGIVDRPTLLTVARLDEVANRKGHHHVLGILPELRQSHPGLVYLIAGDGPGRSTLEQQAATLSIADAVRFLGPVSEARKAALFRLANAFVLPSEGEGFGIVLAEAAICRLPIVYSSLDASAEAVAGVERCWSVDPRAKPQLLAALQDALSSGAQAPAQAPAVRELPGCTPAAFGQAWRHAASQSALGDETLSSEETLPNSGS
ncbi:MAG: glycosyltransferase family 4 protein [Acidobacteriota bacterium]